MPSDGGRKNKASTSSSSIEESVSAVGANLENQWDYICQNLEDSDNPTLQWISENFLRKLSVEAPVLVCYVTSCCFLHLLNVTILPGVSRWLGVRQATNFLNPLHYVFMVSHIFGHQNLYHLRSNMTNLLLVGPSTEHTFGSKNLILIMFVVAVCSGIGHMVFGPPHTTQIGASGVVFALILLNSLVSAKSGQIPVSFVLTTTLFVGDEIWQSLFVSDTIAHSAHLIGALVGTVAGYMIHDHRESERLQKQQVKPGFWARTSGVAKKRE